VLINGKNTPKISNLGKLKMTVQYTNRVGKTYYLREGKTKKQKPRYFFSTKTNGKGEAVEHIPDGYEIYERPENAQVFLRKKLPQLITDKEKQLVEKSLTRLHGSKLYIVDCQHQSITIYESNINVDHFKNLYDDFLKGVPLLPGMHLDDDAIHSLFMPADQNYTAMLRFRLVDKEERIFKAERFCFRGSIDDWIFLDGPDTLENLIKQNVKLLGTESLSRRI